MNADEAKAMITRAAGVLVDTNILLLLIVNEVEPLLVTRFKRTRDRFRAIDAQLLKQMVSSARSLITTPHILTECSNLLGQLSGDHREIALSGVAKMSLRMDERWCSVQQLRRMNSWKLLPRLGITDASIAAIQEEQLVVLTDDALLAHEISLIDGSVINFNHIREL